jgi:hypothetical protein
VLGLHVQAVCLKTSPRMQVTRVTNHPQLYWLSDENGKELVCEGHTLSPQRRTWWLLAWAVVGAGAGHTGATEPRSGVRAAPPRSVEMCCMEGK